MAKRSAKDRLMEELRQDEAAAKKPDIIDRLGDRMERNHADPGAKIGAGHVAGMMRLGLKELARAVTLDQPIEEPGLAGNPTNIEVVRDKEAQPTYPVTEVDEIGPPQATPSIKGQATPKLEREPTDTVKEQGKTKELEI